MHRPNRCVYGVNAGGVLEFVEHDDGQTEWPYKFEGNPLWYDVIGKCASLSQKQVRKALNLAMTTWDLEIDVTFKPTWFDEAAAIIGDFTIDFRDKEEDQYFKNSPSVLAYAYMPGQGALSGNVVFNNSYLWSLDGKPISVKEARKRGYPVLGNPPEDQMLKTYNIIHVLIHELGHILGLRHDEHHDSRDVMDAFYSGKLELSLWDIYRILLKYPRRVFSRWNAYARLKRAFKRIKLRLQD